MVCFVPCSTIYCFYTQVPYVGVKVASTHVLPALITLGSDQNSAVKYASIDALGAVAQHFKSDMVWKHHFPIFLYTLQ